MSERVGALAPQAAERGSRRTVVIRPPGRWPGLGLAELWEQRPVLFALARRSLMVRYRQTAIGISWVIVQPIALMIVFTAFFGFMARMPSDGIPYSVFVLIGLLVWHQVAKILSEGSASLVSNSALITRIYFPRIYFPISVGLATLVDLAVGAIALLGLLFYHAIAPGMSVLLVPAFLLIGLTAGLGAGLWLAAIQATYRDVANMMPFLTQLWFFLSPIIYPSSIVPEPARTLYWLNPMAVTIDGLRWAFANTPAPPPQALAIGATMAVLLLVSGYLFFRKREPNFADTI